MERYTKETVKPSTVIDFPVHGVQRVWSVLSYFNVFIIVGVVAFLKGAADRYHMSWDIENY